MFSSNSSQSNSAQSAAPDQGEEIIEIEIDFKGGIKVDPIGFQGTACDAATAPLYEVLGEVTDKETKPEYFSPDPNNRASSSARSSARQ